MSATTPYEEWFVNRPEALDFLNTVARELHWLTSNGHDLERIRHMLPIQYVRESDPFTCGPSWYDEDYTCSYPCCNRTHKKYSGRSILEFNFELVKGRPGLGHIYIVSCAQDYVSIHRAGRIGPNQNPTIIEKPINQVSGQDLLSAVLLLICEDCMIA
jgi:hypothetical protein